MTTEARNKKESKTDERSNAIANNPCGMCRSFGLPVCKGHGAGGGGGDETKDENSKNNHAPTPNHAPATIKVKDLSSYLENSEVWNSEDDFLYKFNKDFALFSIILDSTQGLIHFKAKEFLSANNKKDLNQLYDKIEDELKQFIDEINAQNISITRKGNDFKISIPDQNLYDQFITRLLNKNLIPDNNYNANLSDKANQNLEPKNAEKEATASYKSPNPFDISNGPKR